MIRPDDPNPIDILLRQAVDERQVSRIGQPASFRRGRGSYVRRLPALDV